MKPQTITTRGKRYFVCEYTGAPISSRYYVPAGKFLKRREGSFATLPILLRHEFEREGGATNGFNELKNRIETFYAQPDIPMQPALDVSRVPLSRNELQTYLEELDMGASWLLVPKAEEVGEEAPRAPSKSKKRRRR